jgi:hypothetical protein
MQNAKCKMQNEKAVSRVIGRFRLSRLFCASSSGICGSKLSCIVHCASCISLL